MVEGMDWNKIEEKGGCAKYTWQILESDLLVTFRWLHL